MRPIGKEQLSPNSLKRIQSSLSGIFKFAKQAGFHDGVNTLEDIEAILAILPEPAATAFAVASYTGLRRGEIEGLTWDDYHDGELPVERSMWNGRESEPKTEACQKYSFGR